VSVHGEPPLPHAIYTARALHTPTSARSTQHAAITAINIVGAGVRDGPTFDKCGIAKNFENQL